MYIIREVTFYKDYMNKIDKTYKILASLEDVWQALVDPKQITAWGAGPNVVMTDKQGEKFSLWNGDIFGKNIEVIENQLLKQEWYGGDWGTPSTVTFRLEDKGDYTSLHLLHVDFPQQVTQEEFDGFASGWDDFYVGPLKALAEKKA